MSEEIFKKLASNLLGLEVDELTFGKQSIMSSNLAVIPDSMMVFEMGLDEFFASLYVLKLREHGIPASEWFLTSGKHDYITNPKSMCGQYTLAYSEKASNAIEEAIKLAEELTAVVRACKKASDISSKTRSQLPEDKVLTIARGIAQKKILERKKMWKEVDKGLELLLSKWDNSSGVGPDDTVLFGNFSVKINNGETTLNLPYLSFHGHQLRNWVRSNGYLCLPMLPFAIFMGHYHRQIVFRRHGVWIAITGHLTKELDSKYCLPHVGALATNVYADKSGSLKCDFLIRRLNLSRQVSLLGEQHFA